MNRISAKRQALYMKRLGYIPQRPLSRAEREKCGLLVKQIRRKPKSKRQSSVTLPRALVAARHQTACNTESSGAYTRTAEADPDTAVAAGRFVKFIDPRSYVTGTGRVRLKGEDYTNLRREAFSRAQGHCERMGKRPERVDHTDYIDFFERLDTLRCNTPAPWDGSIFTRGHLAHLQHGYRKTDTLEGTLWSCAACHFKEHGLQWDHGKAARPFAEKEFNFYYTGEMCVCGTDKPMVSALCIGCRDTLRAQQPALLHVIENGSGDALLGAMGEFRFIVRSAE